MFLDCMLLQFSRCRACIMACSVCTPESQPMKAWSIVHSAVTISPESASNYVPALLPSQAVMGILQRQFSWVVRATRRRLPPPVVDVAIHLIKSLWCRHKHQDNMNPCCSRCSIMACRFHGPLKVEALQQFVADQLLRLPQVTAVKPQSLDKFLARVPQHKVTVLAFSSSSRASLPLRRVAQQHQRHVVVGRVHWNAEVRLGSCLSCCNCIMFGERGVQLRSLLSELPHMQSPTEGVRVGEGQEGFGWGRGGIQGRQTMSSCGLCVNISKWPHKCG